eukprot:scaffold142976_cov22-Tisochrysis_lutea.AAC.1
MSALFGVLRPSRRAGAGSLRALRLGGNTLGTEGLRVLCEGCDLLELRELELKKTKLEGVGVASASASCVAGALMGGAFPRLTELDLRENALGLEGMGMLLVAK